MIKTLALLYLALSAVSGQDVVASFKEVVEDVLVVAPPALLEVKYVEQDVKAELGNTLAVSKAGSQPEVSFAGAESGKQYTLGERTEAWQPRYDVMSVFCLTCSHGGP